MSQISIVANFVEEDIKVRFVTEPDEKENYLQLEYIRRLERNRVDLCPVCVDELIQYFKDGWSKSDS